MEQEAVLRLSVTAQNNAALLGQLPSFQFIQDFKDSTGQGLAFGV